MVKRGVLFEVRTEFNGLRSNLQLQDSYCQILTLTKRPSVRLTSKSRAATDSTCILYAHLLLNNTLYSLLLSLQSCIDNDQRTDLYVLGPLELLLRNVLCLFLSGCPRRSVVSVQISVTFQGLGTPPASQSCCRQPRSITCQGASPEAVITAQHWNISGNTWRFRNNYVLVDVDLLDTNATWTCRNTPTFPRNTLHPSSVHFARLFWYISVIFFSPSRQMPGQQYLTYSGECCALQEHYDCRNIK
jgi:hypothetical protein